MLTQQDYYTIPSCEELDEMAKDGHCVVEGFTIGRRGYGEIHFPDKTDVYGLNLDQLGMCHAVGSGSPDISISLSPSYHR